MKKPLAIWMLFQEAVVTALGLLTVAASLAGKDTFGPVLLAGASKSRAVTGDTPHE